jgi:hypothetical protein
MSVYFRKNAFKVAKKKTLRINKQINVRNRGIVQTINIGTLPARRARRRRIKPRLNQQSRMIQYIPTMPQRNYPQPYISTEYMSQFEKNKVAERIKKMKTADEKYNNQFKLLREQGEKQLLAQQAMKTSYDDTIKNLRTFDGEQKTKVSTKPSVETPSPPSAQDLIANLEQRNQQLKLQAEAKAEAEAVTQAKAKAEAEAKAQAQAQATSSTPTKPESNPASSVASPSQRFADQQWDTTTTATQPEPPATSDSFYKLFDAAQGRERDAQAGGFKYIGQMDKDAAARAHRAAQEFQDNEAGRLHP